MTKIKSKKVTKYIERLLSHLKSDEPTDMSYLNLELLTINEYIDRVGVENLEHNETGVLLEGISQIEVKLKELGLVSNLLRTIKDSIYKNSR